MIEGRNALITGASSGIGRETAYKLAEQGADVALASRSQDQLEEIASTIHEKYNQDAAVIPTDVTERDQVEEVVETAASKLGGLDIVVSNAGVGLGGDVEEIDDGDYQTTMGVNCDGMFYTARAALPHLKQSEGNLIFLGSIAGQYPRAANPVYAATKWWTRGFALSLSAQIGDENVAVTVIKPSEVRTGFAGQDGDPFRDRFQEGEVTEPEDVARAIVTAADTESPNTLNEIDIYRRDKLCDL
ncbi:MAG: SDR family oxidoreductase [Candidatus Nanohaloarchaea archaeon]